MLSNPEFERVAQLEREARRLVAEIFAAQREGRDIAALQQQLDRIARMLVILRAGAVGPLEKVA